MLSYRDMTFCTFYKSCTAGEECFRALTDQVRVEAMGWWKGEDPPICQYLEEPNCFKEIEE